MLDRLSLRARINLLVGGLMLLFVLILLGREFVHVRRGVGEEIVAANRVATQLLQRLGRVTTRDGLPALLDFLGQLGRVRANEITLIDEDGRVLYRSPPSTYKEGRAAPEWFAERVAPPASRQEIALPAARLIVQADPSRAILDGWDDLVAVAGFGAALLLAVCVLVFWRVGRALGPFRRLLAGLERLERGDYAARVPPLPGREAARLGMAVNRMAASFEEHVQSRLREAQAQHELGESRELSRLIEDHMDAERRGIARELHDELGQSVTAIRSLAQSLEVRWRETDASASQTAGLIAGEAARLYESMHGMIPRLAPLTLDRLGLAEALTDLVAQSRPRHPGIALTLAIDPLPDDLGPSVALALYRTAQEGLSNALRHSGATRIDLWCGQTDGEIRLQVCDDGKGLAADWQRPGHYGLRGLRERLRALDGTLELHSPPGLRVLARVPLLTGEVLS